MPTTIPTLGVLLMLLMPVSNNVQEVEPALPWPLVVQEVTTEADCKKVYEYTYKATTDEMLQCGVEMNNTHGGQCVAFIQLMKGSYYTHPKFRGYAGDIKPNSNTPVVGGVVLTQEGTTAHAAVIHSIVDNTLILIESNYTSDEIVQFGREIPTDDTKIVGYFNWGDATLPPLVAKGN